MNYKLLEDIGFSKGEIKVYFTLLKLGKSNAYRLSDFAKVSYSKVSPILSKLITKGLVTYINIDNKKEYQAYNPERILEYLEDKKTLIDNEKAEIKRLIPEIKKQTQEIEQYSLVYEGLKSVKGLYNDILEDLKKNNEDFKTFTLSEDFTNENANLFFKQYDLKRKEMKIKVKLIGKDNQKQFFKTKYKPLNNVEIRFVNYPIPTGLIIWGNNIATIIWGDNPSAFVIHSDKLAKSYNEFFEHLWKSAKK